MKCAQIKCAQKTSAQITCAQKRIAQFNDNFRKRAYERIIKTEKYGIVVILLEKVFGNKQTLML